MQRHNRLNHRERSNDMSYNTTTEDGGYECVLTATSLVIVPRDKEKPCMGPFQCRGQADVDELKEYAKDDLGLEDSDYDLRITVEVDPSIWLRRSYFGH